MKKYKAILFDHDDTLVETIKPKWAQHKHIASTHFGRELTDAELKKHWGKPFLVVLKELYGTDDLERAIACNRMVRHRFPKTPFPDTEPVLAKLKQAGIYVGVVTSTIRENFEYDWGEKQLFDYTQTQEETSVHKPDPAVFEPAKQWLARLGIAEHEVLYVGDALTDYRAAVEAGFDFRGVTTGLLSAEEFQTHGAQTVNSLRELAP